MYVKDILFFLEILIKNEKENKLKEYIYLYDSDMQLEYFLSYVLSVKYNRYYV